MLRGLVEEYSVGTVSWECLVGKTEPEHPFKRDIKRVDLLYQGHLRNTVWLNKQRMLGCYLIGPF